LTVALTLAVLVLLVAGLSRVGNAVINTERARIVSQVGVLASVYGGETAAREATQLNSATLCGFSGPTPLNSAFEVCVDVEGIQRLAHAVDTWSNPVPTLEP
jgi:hypothetical protein